MSFFADAIAHSALLGIALGLLLEINPILSAVIVSILISLGISYLKERSLLSLDAIIGVFFSGAVALGILTIGLLKGYRSDLFGYLFGDILAVSDTDLISVGFLAVLSVTILVVFRRQFTAISFNYDLAKISGLKVRFYEYLLMVLIALIVSLGMKIIGIILISSLVVIPAAAAKNIAGSLRSFFALSALIGVASTASGLLLSYLLDAASGPSIVLTSVFFFFLSFVYRRNK